MTLGTCGLCGMCGAPTKRNVDATETEIERLKKCPSCGSRNYSEEIVNYE